jgi:hypothetical protein
LTYSNEDLEALLECIAKGLETFARSRNVARVEIG